MSNVPSATSTDARTAWVAMARAGVPNRGCTAAAPAGNRPSWAMAKYNRGASICIAPRLPSTHTITTSATAVPPPGPKMASPTCATKAWPSMISPIGITYMNEIVAAV